MTTKLEAGIAVSLALILAVTITVDSIDTTYYCKSEDAARECIRVSSTNITCYHSIGYDRCVNGTWQSIKPFLEKPTEKDETKELLVLTTQQLKVYANNKEWKCGCCEISSYTKCLSNDGKEAYLGELI